MMEGGGKKLHIRYGLILGVLLGVLFYLVFWYYPKENVDLEQLRDQISVLEGDIERAESSNDSLKRLVIVREDSIKLLYQSIDSTAKIVENAKLEIERQRRRFKDLAPNVRDSLIRDFIKSHSGATDGNG